MIPMCNELVLPFKGSSSVNLINEDENEEAVDYLFYCLSTLNNPTNPTSPTSYGNDRQYFLSCLSTFVKMFRDGTNTEGSILIIIILRLVVEKKLYNFQMKLKFS